MKEGEDYNVDGFSLNSICVREINEAIEMIEKFSADVFIGGSASYYEIRNALASLKGMVHLVERRAKMYLQSYEGPWVENES